MALDCGDCIGRSDGMPSNRIDTSIAMSCVGLLTIAGMGIGDVWQIGARLHFSFTILFCLAPGANDGEGIIKHRCMGVPISLCPVLRACCLHEQTYRQRKV